MKTIKLILATTLVALCVCSCGSDKKKDRQKNVNLLSIVAEGLGGAKNVEKDTDTPRTVAERFVSALADGDFEEAASLMVLPDGISVESMAMGFESTIADEFEGATFKIGKAKIDEEAGKATVKATLVKDGETDEDEMSLKKVDGKWKIELL